MSAEGGHRQYSLDVCITSDTDALITSFGVVEAHLFLLGLGFIIRKFILRKVLASLYLF